MPTLELSVSCSAPLTSTKRFLPSSLEPPTLSCMHSTFSPSQHLIIRLSYGLGIVSLNLGARSVVLLDRYINRKSHYIDEADYFVMAFQRHFNMKYIEILRALLSLGTSLADSGISSESNKSYGNFPLPRQPVPNMRRRIDLFHEYEEPEATILVATTTTVVATISPALRANEASPVRMTEMLMRKWEGSGEMTRKILYRSESSAHQAHLPMWRTVL